MRSHHGKRCALVLSSLVLCVAPNVARVAGANQIAAASSYTCTVTTHSGVRCWGENYSGQLGIGTTSQSQPLPRDVVGLTGGVASVSTGSEHACAVTASGGVQCWGGGGPGRLGCGGLCGDGTTPTDVVGLTSVVTAVAVGGRHSCALTTGGGVRCWGDNWNGQLGDGTTTSRSTPVSVVGLTSGVASIAAGGDHTCALTTGGAVRCWGDNSSGQLGNSFTMRRLSPTAVTGLSSGVVAVTLGERHSCALTGSGGVKCWGDNSFGQLGIGSTTPWPMPVDVSGLSSGVLSLAAGAANTCAITAGGGAKCWGSVAHTGTPTDVAGLGTGVIEIAPGGWHMCALKASGTVSCWGENWRGQLGDGTTKPRSSPVAVRSSKLWQDYDDDVRADVAVYRPSTGTWFSLDSSSDNTAYRWVGWGAPTQIDTPVVGDFDGDGLVDPTVYRPANGGWFILHSSTTYTTWVWFELGNPTDLPVPGDYDGDGKTDAAIYRPSEGRWWVQLMTGVEPWTVQFGLATDIPVPGDYDGDGRSDLAVYRPATGTWFWSKSSTDYTQFDYRGWGVPAQGDVPVPGDYDGDGKTDPCVYRPQYGTWFVLLSSSDHTQYVAYGWGTPDDTPVPADYDGDGRTDVAIYRPSTGEWFVRPSGGASSWSVVFGDVGDVPLVVR